MVLKKKRLCEKRKEYCNKHVNKNFSHEIRSYNAIESDRLQGVNANRLGGGVNTIIIKCVLFLHKGLNAEKIVVECDIASLNYASFAHSNRLTIREDNLYLHATHHAPSTVFPLSSGGLDKVYIKFDMGESRKRSKFGLNGQGTEL